MFIFNGKIFDLDQKIVYESVRVLTFLVATQYYILL
jgi:hypothetical protein